jgi:DMSO reductase anchor subunit
MIVTLPLVLFIVLTELAIGAFAVMFVLDWRSMVKRNFLVTYGIIYLGLVGLTYLFQQSFSTPALLNTFPQLDHSWTAYETLPLLLFLILLIPYNLFLWFDKRAGVDGREKAEKLAREKAIGNEQSTVKSVNPASQFSTVRLLRLLSGSLATLAGLTELLVMGMIYRPLEAASLGGALTVATFFAGALALGGVLTAMWLGHWYLVTPALTEKPLQFATTLVLIGVFAQVILAFTAGPIIAPASNTTISHATASTTQSTTSAAGTPTTHVQKGTNVKPANAPVITPLSAGAIGWLRILVGFVIPLVLGSIAWKLIRDRSFQSATGMLYLVVVCTIAGEAIARGLFLMGLA